MKNRVLVFLISSLSLFAKAQDPHLTMYDAAPMFLNSGLTGLFKGDWRLHTQYRTQWRSVNYKPYTSSLFSFDRSIGKKWGFGIQLHNFRSGYGNFNVLQGLVSTSYGIAIDKNKFHNLSFGIQGGGIQKSIELPLLTFNNQYTLTNGGGYDNSLPSGENVGAQVKLMPTVNASVMYYSGKQQSRFNYFAGLSLFNLLRPNESFFGFENRLPIRTYLHLGTRINVNELLYFAPKLLLMHQRKFNQQTLALESGYFLKSSETFLIGSLLFRYKDAFALSLGVKKFNFIFRIAYDINVSQLSTVSRGRGGIEFSLTYTRIKNKPETMKIIPRL
jgi:type IX secretion system PorP/SprF family membrane protein